MAGWIAWDIDGHSCVLDGICHLLAASGVIRAISVRKGNQRPILYSKNGHEELFDLQEGVGDTVNRTAQELERLEGPPSFDDLGTFRRVGTVGGFTVTSSAGKEERCGTGG